MVEVPIDDTPSGMPGSIALVDDTLVLAGEIDTDLCQRFRSLDHDLAPIRCVDAGRVTFFGSPGLSLLAEVARVRGVGVPVLAGHTVRRTLRMSGLDQLFEVRPPG
jgi:anti-anti-sigma regulatory factor